MKKSIIWLFLVVTLCTVLAGCKKKEEEVVTGGWTIDLEAQSLTIPSEALEAFHAAIGNQEGLQIEPIALLGTQVVSGLNYMFFCTETPSNSTKDSSYKVVIVYKDLTGSSTITQIRDFDFNSYLGNKAAKDTSDLVGGWTVNNDMTGSKIKEEVMDAFSKAVETEEASYTPIAVLAHQVVAGTNYAVLCLQENDENSFISVLTIYNDLEGNAEILSNSYVDLADYNS